MEGGDILNFKKGEILEKGGGVWTPLPTMFIAPAPKILGSPLNLAPPQI